MSYRRGKTQMLRDAIHDAERGPSMSGVQTSLGPKQLAEVDQGIRLWLDTWILPAMRANLPQPRVKKPD